MIANKSLPNKVFLNDIVIIRLILIIMLLVYHSFAPFCGGWNPLENSATNIYYYWIGKFAYSFFLEAFVFISGLLAGFQASKNPISNQNYKFIIKKLKRLGVPSIFFSLLYFYFFYDWNGTTSFAFSVIQGCGHLWFLPMLFWCFVGLYILSKININPYITLVFSIILMIASNGFLPIRIGSSMYYFIFFILGFLVYNKDFNYIFQPRIYSILVYCLLFIIITIYNAEYQIHTAGGVIIKHILQGLNGFTGIMMCYLIISLFRNRISNLPKWLVVLSQYSFGIYIFQQFILKGLYYYTPLSYKIDFLLLPWIGLLCALIVSIIITHFLFKFRIGRLLIG